MQHCCFQKAQRQRHLVVLPLHIAQLTSPGVAARSGNRFPGSETWLNEP